MKNHILAIETSCDETSAAVITGGEIKSNVVSTQRIHEKYGGVVPELASRSHHINCIPIIDTALLNANVNKKELSAVAFTQGPGLLGALLVGCSLAKSMALALNIPLIGVHHMKAHILSHWIEKPIPKLPFLCLTLSGGHTQVVLVEDEYNMKLIGETKDDAIGEAFDKCAKLLGFSYPGGYKIDQKALQGNPKAYKFPITEMPNYDFSFSGIKTAFMYFLKQKGAENSDFISENINDLCASIQYTLVEMVIRKIKTILKDINVQSIGIAGGVAANQGLRDALEELGNIEGKDIFIPDKNYCTDNAAMIAQAAYFQYLRDDFTPFTATPKPRFPI